MVNNALKFLELLRIPGNSHKFSLVFKQFPIIPQNSKDSFLQTWNYWEFLGIHPFPSISRNSKVLYLCSFACLGINWNSWEFPELWEFISQGFAGVDPHRFPLFYGNRSDFL